MLSLDYVYAIAICMMYMKVMYLNCGLKWSDSCLLGFLTCSIQLSLSCISGMHFKLQA